MDCQLLHPLDLTAFQHDLSKETDVLPLQSVLPKIRV